MLKCGGTISKTHSVCVPNKVDVVDKFPRSADKCGLIRLRAPPAHVQHTTTSA